MVKHIYDHEIPSPIELWLSVKFFFRHICPSVLDIFHQMLNSAHLNIVNSYLVYPRQKNIFRRPVSLILMLFD